jgi:preprotein translocase subunit Sec61beta
MLFEETDMAINGLSVARRRVATIGLIVGTMLLVATFILRGIDLYQTQHSISPAAAASLALAVLAVVIGAATFFYAVLRRK